MENKNTTKQQDKKPKSRLEQAADFDAKAKAMRRAEKAFWEEVENRLPEVKERFDLESKTKSDFHKPAESAASSFQMHTNKGTQGSAEGV